ncbi:S26 family signal peptidase [Aporhodopirellula aestuarii]|uniref:Signal peptidase I n=1 Tax=Aporhodopirellula aestuarii TaxID=2950107 RepID=A0ABT0U3H3_9BACT|nr:S26 family signal peptidase [Aporhodopirellula aestuarii]
MNPTLWDASDFITCDHCEMVTRVDRGILHRAVEQCVGESGRGANVVCWHCGTGYDVNQLRGVLESPATPPDIIGVVSCSDEELHRGDVVLVRRYQDVSNEHVKRIVARPGQVVSVDESGGLLVDGLPPSLPSDPAIPVDFDRYRQVSRWRADVQNEDDLSEPGWIRQDDRSWESAAGGGWLIYENRSVYRAVRPVRILDDYPGNIGIQRKLFPADGVSLQMHVSSESSLDDVDLVVWNGFWTPAGIDVQRHVQHGLSETGNVLRSHVRPIDPSINHASTVEPLGPATHEVVAKADFASIQLEFERRLSATRPVGLFLERRLHHSHHDDRQAMSDVTATLPAVRIRDLEVYRDLVYRASSTRVSANRFDSQRDESVRTASGWKAGNTLTTGAPFSLTHLHLGADEWFVVGDNLPLSIDSRHWGSVRSREIVGRLSDFPLCADD